MYSVHGDSLDERTEKCPWAQQLHCMCCLAMTKSGSSTDLDM